MNRQQCSEIPGIDTTQYWYYPYKSDQLEIAIDIDYCTIVMETYDFLIYVGENKCDFLSRDAGSPKDFPNGRSYTHFNDFNVGEQFFFPNLNFANINEQDILNKIN